MEKTLKINARAAKKLYLKASNEMKALLEESFGKDKLELKVTEWMFEFNDVLEYHEKTLTSFDDMTYDLKEDEVAYIALKLITAALNEDWVPDWDDTSKFKYYPCFDMRSKNFAFVTAKKVAVGEDSVMMVNSPFVFKSHRLAVHAGVYFISFFKSFLKHQTINANSSH